MTEWRPTFRNAGPSEWRADTFGAVGTVIKKVSDPIIDVIRNSQIRHFIQEGGMSDCVEGLAKVQGNDTYIG